MGKLYINGKDLERLSSKYFYEILITNRLTRPICEPAWNGQLKLFNIFQWRSIWMNQTVCLSLDRKLVEFNFKIIHRILPNGINLCRWKITNSDKCCLCNLTDTYEHMFLHCRRIGTFWNNFVQLVKKIDIHITIDFLSLFLVTNLWGEGSCTDFLISL